MLPKVSFDHAVQSLMDSAVDPSQWPAAMETLTRYSGSVGTVLFPVKGRSPGTPHSASLGEGLETYFRDGWHLRDERTRGLPLIKSQGIFVDQDFASDEEISTSDYYRGFLAKFETNWSAVVGFSDPDDEWCLVFERGDKQGFFDHREQADLVRFAGPLSQAAALARSVAYTNVASVMEAYQSVGCASFLIDQYGRVVQYNAQAQRLLGDGLELSRGVLRSSHPPDNLALNDLIASRRSSKKSDHYTNQVAIVHRAAKRPLVVRAVVLTGLAASLFSSASTLLLVSDTHHRRPSTPVDTLVKAFGLTASEAALVVKLEQEIALTDAAELLNISFETARTHLKRIMSKTQTRRQQELLMLINRLSP
ncbi:helix-turn-helix transcriptional regulator [soil metagenome]